MNQILKRRVYKLGNPDQVDYVAKRGGMDTTETEIFRRLHAGESDLQIQGELGLSDSVYEDMELSVSLKTAVGVLMCIEQCRQADLNN